MTGSTPELIGSLFGLALLAVLIWGMSGLLERFLVCRLVDDPVVGKVLSVAATYLALATFVAFVLNGIGRIHGVIYLHALPGALVVAFFECRRGLKLRRLQEDDLARTFE